MKKVVLFLIKTYSKLISPLLGKNCRFYPTCSSYGYHAVDKLGVMKGGILTLKRILKCHPWHHGKFDDPVPDEIAWSELLLYKRSK